MRKYLRLSILISLTSLLVGCNKKNENKKEETTENASIFFALKDKNIEVMEDNEASINYVCYKGEEEILNPEIDFKIENQEIATINGNKVVAKKEGSTTLTATYSNFTYTIPVNVIKENLVYLVDILESEYFVFENENKKVEAKIILNNQEVNEYPTFTSSNEDVITINENGLLTTHSIGSSTITATYKNATDTCTVYVEEASEVYLDSYNIKAAKNEEVKIIPHTMASEIKFISSDETICKISNDGTIIPVSIGNCKARIKAGSSEAVCQISIFDYAIKTPDDLMAIQDDLKASYYLKNDIDMEGINYRTIAHYEDSKSGKIGFDGVFDGNNKTIKNLDYSYTGYYTNSNSLFGVITENGIVRNLNLEVSGTALRYSGAICNILQYGTVKDCYVKVVNLTSNDDGSYGFGGVANQNRGKISNCIIDYSDATLKGNIAGIVGKTYAQGTINNCFVVGSKVNNIIFNLNGCQVDTSTCYNVASYQDIYGYDLNSFKNWKLDYDNHSLPVLER